MGSEGRLLSIILRRVIHEVEPGREGKLGVGSPVRTLGRLDGWGWIKGQSGAEDDVCKSIYSS